MDLRPDRAPASEYSGPDRIPLRTLISGIRAEGWKIWIPLGDIKFKMCDGREMLIKGVKHVPGLRRNLISLGLLHDKRWLYHAAPDKKTLRVIREGKTIMVGEKSSAYQYKLMGSVVKGGVMDCIATMAVFCPKVDKVAGSASSGCFK